MFEYDGLLAHQREILERLSALGTQLMVLDCPSSLIELDKKLTQELAETEAKLKAMGCKP